MDMGWISWLFAILFLLPLAFFFVAGLQWWTRGTPLRRIRDLDPHTHPPRATEEGFLDMVAIHLQTPLAPGHDVELFHCGDELYPRLLDDLLAARALITWHVFWFRPGRLADRLKDVLTERAEAGVKILLLRDWFGSRPVPGRYWEELRGAGVEVATFRRPSFGHLFKAQQRSHARTVAIDGRVGYTGGFAIADEWLGDGRSPGSWRDTSVRFEGPSVHQLQAAFAIDWVEATGELVVGPLAFPDSGGVFLGGAEPDGEEIVQGASGASEAPEVGEVGEAVRSSGSAGPGALLQDERGGPAASFQDCLAGFFRSSPSLGGTQAERLFALSMGGARELLWIASGYFVPDTQFRHLLMEAAGRGVDVRILHPGPRTDRRATLYAARNHYEELLEGGVRIYEYRPTMMHAKMLVVDGVWAAVGTPNLDNRSMALNDEVSVLMRNHDVADHLCRQFQEDLEHADEVDLETFRSRGAWERTKERVWDVFRPFL